MAKAKKAVKKFSADQMMLNVVSSLVRDFQSNLNDPCFCSDFHVAVRRGDIAEIRRLCPVPNDQMEPSEYKMVYQLQSVLKRYRFKKDLYSDQELESKALLGFLATQDRLAHINLDGLPLHSQVILELASRYIAKVLGEYSAEEHRDLCRFGRKASVGVPGRLACEAARWEVPLSGSSEQIVWFDSEMGQVPCVRSYWARQTGRDPEYESSDSHLAYAYRTTSSLALTLVPKTFKSLRAIMPNTTIGSYMSSGLGEMMRKRLKRVGYDIRTLQMRHRYLAKEASIHGLHVTADLSAASDSITEQLVERLFPADWYEVLQQSRIRNVELPGKLVVQPLTYCTMGIGYTFPLQTLVFLALLKAIQAFYYPKLKGRARDYRTISVYGDDLIYASRMHNQVVEHFEEFGFVINLDKTFHEGSFRESCGGDYYRGVDVRPFQPQNGPASVRERPYEAMLYKYVNCLLARWSEHEIGRTLNYLCSEIESVTGKAKLVPIDYPDDSGIKCSVPAYHDFLIRTKCCMPKHTGHGRFRFSFLRLTPDERKEDRHAPYLWLALRGGPIPVFYSGYGSFQEPPGPLHDLITETVGIREDCRTLIWRDDKPIRLIRGIAGKRLSRKSSYVVINDSGRYTRESGISCFETRR